MEIVLGTPKDTETIGRLISGMMIKRTSKLHGKNEQNGVSSSEKRTPSDIHGRQVLLVSRLHDQLIHLAVNRKWNRLLGHEAPKFISDVFQNAGRSVGYIYVSTAL